METCDPGFVSSFPRHPQDCGPCEDCTEFLAEEQARGGNGLVPSRTTPTTSTWIDRESGNRCHAVVHHPDGSISIPTMRVKLGQLLKHAKRHGVEGVLEVAKSEGHEDLGSLKVELNRIAAGRRRRRFEDPTRLSFTAEERLDVIAELWRDGATKAEISKRTGFSPSTVDKYLAALPETSDEHPQTRINKGPDSPLSVQTGKTRPPHSRGVKARRRELVRRAYVDEGLIPLVIAEKLNMSMRTVARYLRELVADGAIPPLPAYLSLSGAK